MTLINTLQSEVCVPSARTDGQAHASPSVFHFTSCDVAVSLNSMRFESMEKKKKKSDDCMIGTS